MILSGDPKHLPQDLILYPFSGFPSLRGVRDEAIQSEPPSLRGVRDEAKDSLGKSIKLSSIFFIETRCRISWTATGLSRKKILRGDGEEWTATGLSRKKILRGDGEEWTATLLAKSKLIHKYTRIENVS